MATKNSATLTRRQSLKLGLASAGLFGVTGGGIHRASAQTVNAQAARSGLPRNIIFMVSDGMSAGTLTLSDTFSRLVRSTDSVTNWASMLTRSDVANGLQETFSRDSIVTDSAAAASAWGSGSRVDNGALNMLPDGTALTPLAALVKDSGRKMALVTTTRMTHATPAGFATVAESRDQEDDIAEQFLDRVDILMGGGFRHFDASTREDGRDLISAFRESGYAFWNHRDQVIAGERPDRVLGLFADSHLPYTVDHRLDEELSAQTPTLAEMTRAALDILEDSSEGFLMQVEGGRVDHAAHDNDAAGILWDQLAFDDAVGVALEFAQNRGDTLVIVTSDHGNANPGLNSYGGRTNRVFEKLAEAKISFERLRDQIRNEVGEGEAHSDYVSDLVKTYFDIDISSEHAEVVASALNHDNNPNELNSQLNGVVGTLGQVLGNHNGVQFTGTSHTADYVIVSAYGPGMEHFAGLRPNTDAFAQITRLFEIDFANPSIAPQEAWRRSLPTPAPVHAG